MCLLAIIRQLLGEIKPLLPSPSRRLRGRGKHRRNIGGRPPPILDWMMARISLCATDGLSVERRAKRIGSGKTLHRYFQDWTRARVFKRMCGPGLPNTTRSRADGSAIGRCGDDESAIGRASDRPNRRIGRSAGWSAACWLKAKAWPLAIEVGPANRHEVKLLAATLDGIVVERPEPSEPEKKHLCMDKG